MAVSFGRVRAWFGRLFTRFGRVGWYSECWVCGQARRVRYLSFDGVVVRCIRCHRRYRRRVASYLHRGRIRRCITRRGRFRPLRPRRRVFRFVVRHLGAPSWRGICVSCGRVRRVWDLVYCGDGGFRCKSCARAHAQAMDDCELARLERHGDDISDVGPLVVDDDCDFLFDPDDGAYYDD